MCGRQNCNRRVDDGYRYLHVPQQVLALHNRASTPRRVHFLCKFYNHLGPMNYSLLTWVLWFWQLIGLIVLDMTQKVIAGFFIIILACNYLNFLGFYKILDTLPGLPGKKL